MSRLLQFIFLVLLLAGLAFWQRPDGRLHIVFFATAGDAVLVQTPGGAYILIDGGSDPSALTGALGRRLPFWQRQLDAVILTSPDAMHLPGQIGALARYQVKRVIAPTQVKPNAAMREWQRLLREAGQTPTLAQPGLRLQIDKVRIEVLASSSERDQGLILQIRYGAQVIVLAHSASQADEAQLTAAGNLQRVALLSYPWQRDPNNPFVTALQPAAIVFSDGRSEKHSAELTMPQRAIHGAATYHERLHGEIEWIGDGRRATINVTKNYCSSLPTRSSLPVLFQSVSASCSNRVRS